MTDREDDNSHDQTDRLAGFMDKARRTLGKVPFLEQALAAYYCATDPLTPKHVKAVLVGALAYFIVPADVVPDFIAGLGFTDDAAVFWAAWNRVSAHVTDAHRRQAATRLEQLQGPGSGNAAD